MGSSFLQKDQLYALYICASHCLAINDPFVGTLIGRKDEPKQ